MSRFNGEQPAGIGVKWDERTFSLSQPKAVSYVYIDQFKCLPFNNNGQLSEFCFTFSSDG